MKYSRRKFLGSCLRSGSLIIGGGVLLDLVSSRSAVAGYDKVLTDTVKQDTSKNKGAGAQQKKNPCDDLTGVSAADIEKRKKLAYVKETPIPDNHCSNCALYIPPAKDKPCGGCMLFKGPVRAEGYCAYWAPANS